jgi:flagellar motor switch protein FliG
MGNRSSIVVTAYGHDKSIDKIAVSLFEAPENHCGNNQNSDAKTYCDMINSLALKDDTWVFAKILSENARYALDMFLPLNFSDILIKLDDRAIQRILSEVDSQELIRALKDQDEIVKERVFTNMSTKASQLLKEDMEFMGPVRKIDVKNCQGKILNIIRRLEQNGEIVVPWNKGEVVE